MYRNIGSTDALLNRVSQQLNQSRKSTKSNDDLQNYLSSLKKQTKGNTVTFKDISDISLSSDDTIIDISDSSNEDVQPKSFKNDLDFQSSLYIKPPTNLSAMNQNQTDEMLTMKSFDSETGNLMPSFRKERNFTQTSSALDRASKLFAKFGKKSSAVSTTSIGKLHKNDNDKGSKKFQNDRKSQDNDYDKSTSDDNIGKSGRRFLKPQPSKDSLSGGAEKESDKKSELKTESVKEVSHSYSGVTSGDESLAEFIGRLESPIEETQEDITKENKQNKNVSTTLKLKSQKSQISHLRVRRSPSPSLKIATTRTPSPGIKSSIEDITIAETIPEEDVADVEEVLSQSTETEGAQDLNEGLSRMNIYNIDDLEPASNSAVSMGKNETREHSEQQQTSQTQRKKQLTHRKESVISISEDIPERDTAVDIFSSFGVHGIEELLPRNQQSSLSNYQTTISTSTIIKTASHLEGSVEEIVFENPSVSVTSLSRKKSPSQAVIGSYSEDFTSLSSSKCEGEEYTEDFHTVSVSKTVDSVSNTSTIYVTKSKVSKKKHEHKTSKNRNNVGTQTQDTDFKPCWECLYKNQDWKGRPLYSDSRTNNSPPKTKSHPCNIHLPMNQNVYIPNLQAIQDLMKQQIEFTQQFCESQKYLYHNLTDSIRPTYLYTTLKDTKEYIKKHQKPKLTLKKALKLVDLEARL